MGLPLPRLRRHHLRGPRHQGELASSLRVQPFGLLVTLATVLFALWALIGHALGRDLSRTLAALDWALWARVTGTLLALAWIYKLAAVRGWV